MVGGGGVRNLLWTIQLCTGGMVVDLSAHLKHIFRPPPPPPTFKGRTIRGVRNLFRVVDLGAHRSVVDLGPIFNFSGHDSTYGARLRLNDFLWVLRTTSPTLYHHGVRKTLYHLKSCIFHQLSYIFLEKKLFNLCPNLHHFHLYPNLDYWTKKILYLGAI
jgi:hypothetical protein